MDYLRKINNNIRAYTDLSSQLSIEYIDAIKFNIEEILSPVEKSKNVFELKQKYIDYINSIKNNYLYLSVTILLQKEMKISDIENKLFFDFIAFEVYSNEKQDKFRKLVWNIIDANRNVKIRILKQINMILESPNNLDKYNSLIELKTYLKGLEITPKEILTPKYKALLDDLFRIRLQLLNKEHSKLNGNVLLQIKESFFSSKSNFIPEKYLNNSEDK